MEVSIIVPCFNVSDRLDVNKFINYISQNNHIHFVFVDDGSTDNKSSIISRIISKYPSQVSMIKNETNKGKAETVRIGVVESLKMNPDLIGYYGFRYLLPAYPFGLLAIAAYFQIYVPKIKKYFKYHFIFFPSIILIILLFNSFFSTINLAVFYKVFI